MVVNKMLSTKESTRKRFLKKNYNSLFGSKGSLIVLIGNLETLTENMEKYDNVSDKPLQTLGEFVTAVVKFRKANSKTIGFLKKKLDDDQARLVRVQSLDTILKHWLPNSGIRYDARSFTSYPGPIGGIITFHAHDGTILRIEELQKLVTFSKAETLGQAKYYKLKPMVGQIRAAMLGMIRELKAINSSQKIFSFW